MIKIFVDVEKKSNQRLYRLKIIKINTILSLFNSEYIYKENNKEKYFYSEEEAFLKAEEIENYLNEIGESPLLNSTNYRRGILAKHDKKRIKKEKEKWKIIIKKHKKNCKCGACL